MRARGARMRVRALPRDYILRVEGLFGGAAACSGRATVDFFADSLAAGLPVRAMTPTWQDAIAAHLAMRQSACSAQLLWQLLGASGKLGQ